MMLSDIVANARLRYSRNERQTIPKVLWAVAYLIVLVIGWAAGAYVYFGMLWVLGGDPTAEGGIHIGIFPLGLAGSLAGWRIVRRLRFRKER